MTVLLPNRYSNLVNNFFNVNDQIQIAGIDLTVQSIERFDGVGYLGINKRQLPQTITVEDKDNVYSLLPGGYQLRYNESIRVPMDAIALVFPRSSLMRSGATIHTAVWDPGYEGIGMGLLTVFRKIKIEKNTRVAQIIFISTENTVEKGYSGAYQKEGLEVAGHK